MKLPLIYSADDMIKLVERAGFLPFFKWDVTGFSVEDCCPPELWFAPDIDGPWEWKGPAARSGKCMYAKLFAGKAGFVSLEWLPDFVNYRRSGYDFDSRFDDGLAQYKDKCVFDAVPESGSVLSKKLKSDCGYVKGGNRGFDTVITRLQMQTYLAVADFEYMTDRHGKPYGWGVARYARPETLFGADAVRAAYKTEPEISKEKILKYLHTLLPEAGDKQIKILLGNQ